MNSFYSQEELETIGFKRYGTDVLISRKCSIYSPDQIEIGHHVRIDDFVILSGRIAIGDHVHIAAYAAVYGGEKGVYIGDFVGLSSRVTVYGASDDYSGTALTNPTVPVQYRNVISAPVYIGRHVIVGATSVVLPGVVLKEGSAFGCFSFITHDSEEWSVNVGIPAHKIKEREKKILDLEQMMTNDIYHRFE